MRRSLLPVFLLLLLCLLAAHCPAKAQTAHSGAPGGDAIPIMLDSLPLEFDVSPAMREGRVFVPFRAIAEALSVEVTWQAESEEVLAEGAGVQARLQIGNRTAFINDNPKIIDVPPFIIKDRTFIPLRFFSEAFGCRVDWFGQERGVHINTPVAGMKIIGFYALGSGEASSWRDLFGADYPAYGKGHTDLVDELALGWYSLDEEGHLLTYSRTGWQRPPGWERVLAVAREFGLRTEMVIHEADGEGTITALLSDREAVTRAVREIAAEARLYAGVNLNLEGLGLTSTGEELQQVREHFTFFCQLLSRQLRDEGKKLTLTLHPLNSPYSGYDYQVLGEAADRIIVMAHDYGPRPEPLPMVQEAIILAREAVPAKKLVLAISVASESADSLLEKVEIAKRYGLEGISLWRLGIIPEEMWRTLEAAV